MYIESILAVATFLRTGRIDSARAVLHPNPTSPLAQLVDKLAVKGQSPSTLVGSHGARVPVCTSKVRLQSLGWGQRPDTRG